MALEDRHLDVLQNIEFAIVSVYREQHDLRDLDVMRGLDALIDVYRAEVRGHTPKEVDLAEPEHTVFERTKAICEVRLGRQTFESVAEIPEPQVGRSSGTQTGLGKIFRSIADKFGRPKVPVPSDEDDMVEALEDEVNAEVILACLRKIRRSVERWNKRGGPQGYLQFVQEHV